MFLAASAVTIRTSREATRAYPGFCMRGAQWSGTDRLIPRRKMSMITEYCVGLDRNHVTAQVGKPFNLNPAVVPRFMGRSAVDYNRWKGSGWVHPHWRLELPALEEVVQRLTDDSIPSLQRVQLLRSFPQFSQESSDANLSLARQLVRFL